MLRQLHFYIIYAIFVTKAYQLIAMHIKQGPVNQLYVWSDSVVISGFDMMSDVTKMV